MSELRFEWDKRKEKANIKKHGDEENEKDISDYTSS